MTKRSPSPQRTTPAAPAGKRPRGRPCLYNEETANRICERMATGESLRKICSADDMPHEATVRYWVIYDHQGFAARYARARELQVESWVSELVDVARDTPPDSGHVAKAKLISDNIKWISCKLLPRRYGERLDATLTGADGGPVLVSTALSPLSALPQGELQVIQHILQRRAGVRDQAQGDGDGGDRQD